MAAIELAEVSLGERDTLFRLLQYSLYEESAFDGNEMGDDGLFAYPEFDAWFSDQDRAAYFIRSHEAGKLLGFVMVGRERKWAPSGHSIAEFMILPPYRRRGIGRAAAAACFRLHPGLWEVAPSWGSESAFRFWERTITGLTGRRPDFVQGVFVFSSIPC